MSDLTSDSCSLAHSILQDLFGTHVANVCRELLQKGPMTLAEMTRGKAVEPSLLRSCLLVLIQHNCVHCYLQPIPGTQRPPQFVYRAHLQSILLNLRKPWYVEHIKDTCDEMCENIVEALIENGRLRLNQIWAIVAGRKGMDVSAIKDEVTSAFVGLVHDKSIERCPSCLLPMPVATVHPGASKRFAPKLEKNTLEREQALIEAYKKQEQERFKLPTNLLLESAFMDKTTKKRKAGSLDEEGSSDEEVILWRINTEEFNRSFRHKACVDFVSSKICPEAGFALKCMLHVTKSVDASINEDVSRPVSLDEIMASFDTLTSRMDSDVPESLEGALKALKEDQLELVTYMGEQAGGSVFCVNLTRIIECCQLIHVETTIRDRFGIKALRIFRLLLLKRQLEQKQIADLSMLDLKETRTVLYRMMKAGYVHMQDIPQTADHAASRTFFTWRVRLQDATAQLRKDMYKATLHTHCRLMHELKKGNELMELLDISQTHSEPVHITEKQRKQAGKLSRIVQVLEKSLFELDSAIAIINNFSTTLP